MLPGADSCSHHGQTIRMSMGYGQTPRCAGYVQGGPQQGRCSLPARPLAPLHFHRWLSRSSAHTARQRSCHRGDLLGYAQMAHIQCACRSCAGRPLTIMVMAAAITLTDTTISARRRKSRDATILWLQSVTEEKWTRPVTASVGRRKVGSRTPQFSPLPSVHATLSAAASLIVP